jgi:hypothetical protein
MTRISKITAWRREILLALVGGGTLTRGANVHYRGYLLLQVSDGRCYKTNALRRLEKEYLIVIDGTRVALTDFGGRLVAKLMTCTVAETDAVVARFTETAPELRTVREWLFDYFATIDGTKMVEILADVATREVESFADARGHVNNRIDAMRSWLDGTRPSPSPVYEPEAFQAWVAARKLQVRQ